MSDQLLVFEDFHVHGASAPEWNQRYWQMSPGVMRSSLSEWSAAGVHVFRKWMNQRVVQQGGLPRGQLCLALLGNVPADGMRVQGREFRMGDLLLLRGGEEFEIQRPAGVELLSVTFDAATFAGYLEAARLPDASRKTTAEVVVRLAAQAFDALRRALLGQLSGAAPRDAQALMRAARESLAGATKVPAQRASSVTAARIVKACQEIVLTEHRDQPLRIGELCRRLRTSRRTVQGSFNLVAGTSPVVYLRNLRLNAARRRLMSSPADALSVSQAATEAGFDHLGHFAGGYKALFGELPSRTRRLLG